MTMTPAAPHLLNVDDNEAGRYARSRLLRQYGYRVTEAATGGEALTLAVQARPQIICLDLNLPDLDGIAVTRHLRSDPRTASIMVLHLTATYCNLDHKVAGLEEGADGYLAVPVEPRELLATVKALLRIWEGQQALRDSEERLRLAQRYGGVGVWSWDVQSGALWVAPELEELHGVAPGSFRTYADWAGRIDPNVLAAGEAARDSALAAGGAFELEYPIHPGTPRERWLLARGQGEYDESGQLVRVLGVNIDMTERKQAEDQIRKLLSEAQTRRQELREKQEQLVQAAKLASIGELATGLAHELNNPLNNIALFLGNALDKIDHGMTGHPLQGPLRGNVEAAEQQIRRAADIIRHLRIFARPEPVKQERVSINRVLESALSFLREQFRLGQIEVQLHLAPAMPEVLGNPIHLEQVFVNLLSNARDAVEQRARRQITIESDVSGERVTVTIRDSGPGIRAEILPRIFDPFFTTKDVGKGTGLGLSISYGIIKDHGGTIEAESRPADGATLFVRLPLGTD